MCKAWDDHKKRGIQEGRYLEIYSLVQDGIIEPELGAKRLNMTFADFERAMQKAGCKRRDASSNQPVPYSSTFRSSSAAPCQRP